MKRIKLRPFDKHLFDFDYFTKLPKEAKAFIIKYMDEAVNGHCVKKDSIFDDKTAQKNKLKEIKENKESYAEFKASKKEYEKKHNKKITELDFVKVLWQRESNRLVNARRYDMYATDLNRDKIQNIGIEYSTMQEEETLDHIQQQERTSQDEFLYYFKANRIDYFIWKTLREIVDLESLNTKFFNELKEDLKNKNEQFEKKEFSRTKYMLYLYSAFCLCEMFSKNQDNKADIKVIKNIFDNVVYPRTQKESLKKEIE